jgi:quercetin dioxygenase-like cupin family protein
MKSRLISVTLLASLFLSASADDPAIEIEALIKSTQTWAGDPLPEYPEGQPEITLLRITIPPHAKLPLHYHPVINAGILLEGELTVNVSDGSEKHLKAGDTLVELVNINHFGENTGDVPAVILVFYAGIEGSPITVKVDSKE